MKADNLIIQKINETFHKNTTKLIVSLIVMLLINSLIASLVLGVSSIMPVFSLFTAFGSVFVSLVLYYGLSVIFGNFYLGKPTIIGDLFIGLKDSRRILNISLIVLGITFAIMFVIFVPLVFYGMSMIDIQTEQGMTDFSSFSMELAIYMLFITMGIMALFGIPRAMLFPVMHNNPNIKLKEALKQSRQLLKGKVFKFIWFCIKSCKVPLLIYVVSFGLGFVLLTGFFASILSLISTISFYYSLIYVILSINAYYYELVGYSENQESEEKSEILQIGENPLLIEENQERESEKGETFDSEANLEKTPTENHPTEEV